MFSKKTALALFAIIFFAIIILASESLAISQRYWQVLGEPGGEGGNAFPATCSQPCGIVTCTDCVWLCTYCGTGTGCSGERQWTFRFPPNSDQIAGIFLEELYYDDYIPQGLRINGTIVPSTGIADHGCVRPVVNHSCGGGAGGYYPNPRHDRYDYSTPRQLYPGDELWRLGPARANTISMTVADPPDCGTLNYAGVKIRKDEYVNNASSCEFLPGFPSTMIAGEQLAVNVRVENTGETPWKSEWNYRLGLYPDEDPATPAVENPWTTNGGSPGRVELESTETIYPSNPTGMPGSVGSLQEKSFTFNLKAPTIPGTYNLTFKMVQDGYEWFGGTCSRTITVRENLASCGAYIWNAAGNTDPTPPIQLYAGSEIPVFFDVADASGVPTGSLSLWDSTITNPYQLAPTMPQKTLVWKPKNLTIPNPITTDLNKVCTDIDAANCFNETSPLVDLKPENHLIIPSSPETTNWFRFVFKIKVPSTPGIYSIDDTVAGYEGPAPKFQMVQARSGVEEWFPANCGANPNGSEGCCGPNTVEVIAVPPPKSPKSCEFSPPNQEVNINTERPFTAGLQYFNFTSPSQGTVDCGSTGILSSFTCEGPDDFGNGTCNFSCTYSRIGGPFTLAASLNDTASPTPITCNNPPNITVTAPLTCSISQPTTANPANLLTSQTSTLIKYNINSQFSKISLYTLKAFENNNPTKELCNYQFVLSPQPYSVNGTYTCDWPLILEDQRVGRYNITLDAQNNAGGNIQCSQNEAIIIKPPTPGGLVEIKEILLSQNSEALSGDVPFANKTADLVIQVVVKNADKINAQRAVELKISDTTHTATISGNDFTLNGTTGYANHTVPTATLQGLEESKTFTITAVLSGRLQGMSSAENLDEQEKSFVVQRAGVNVPEGNPLMAFAVVGIVLGIIYFSGRKKQ